MGRTERQRPPSTITQVFPDEAPMSLNAPLPTHFRLRSRPSDEEPMTPTREFMKELLPLDPGFNQRQYSDSELEEGEANLDELPVEQSPPQTHSLMMTGCSIGYRNRKRRVRPRRLRGGRPYDRR